MRIYRRVLVVRCGHDDRGLQRAHKRARCRRRKMMMHPGPGVDGPGPGVLNYPPAMRMQRRRRRNWPSKARRGWKSAGTYGAGPVRFRAAGGARPLQLPAGSHLSPEALQYRRPSGGGVVSDRGGRGARPRTEAFLAHNAIPVQFTEEDFDQVLSGNFVTKVSICPIPSTRNWPWPASRPWSARGWSRAWIRSSRPPVAARSWPSFAWATRTCKFRRRGRTADVGAGPPAPAGYRAPAAVGGMPFAYPAARRLHRRRDGARRTGCRCAARPSAWPVRRISRWGSRPALQKHSIVNHTRMQIPEPVHQVRIDVKQKPGYSLSDQPPESRRDRGAILRRGVSPPACARPRAQSARLQTSTSVPSRRARRQNFARG